jgi:Iron-sulfur binding domain of endonuclease III
VCDARKPKCDECSMADICPSAGVPVTAPTTKRPAKKSPAKKSTAKKSTAKKSTAKKKSS